MRTNGQNGYHGNLPKERMDEAMITGLPRPGPGEHGPIHFGNTHPSVHRAPDQLEALQRLTRQQLELIGEDVNREGLLDTPARVAKAVTWFTRGYSLDIRTVVGSAIFEEEHRGMVLVRDIEMYSLCEHHLLPFFGKVHIAYIPNGRVIGLSKLPRLVEVFARRLQVQERLTHQVAEAVEEVLQPGGVAVQVEAVHLCMMMRGVEKQGSSTVTTAFTGRFLDDLKVREEFYYLTAGRNGR